ncbi:MAG TPA: amino acid-binding protein [Micromonosporaceae bacterium]|nr:amino acid-binding protein [Micromonosporaceae bacterium]
MELAVTVIGPDRPGIVAEVAEALARLGANLTDSTMTRLRGHFAMTLICTSESSVAEVEAALQGMSGLIVTVGDVGSDEPVVNEGGPYLLSLHGADRLGIVAAVTRAVAEQDGNITDLSTRLIGPLYVLLAEVYLPSAKVEELTKRLAELTDELGVDISLRPMEADLL